MSGTWNDPVVIQDDLDYDGSRYLWGQPFGILPSDPHGQSRVKRNLALPIVSIEETGFRIKPWQQLARKD